MSISERIAQPSPADVRAARERAGLTQEQAARVVSPGGDNVYRVWQNWEAGEGTNNHRVIPLASWELFLLMTGQHPTLSIAQSNE